MKRALSPTEKAFYRGFAAAIGTLAKEFVEPSLAAHIAHSNGVTLAALVASGVDAPVLKTFKSELAATEERAAKQRKKKAK